MVLPTEEWLDSHPAIEIIQMEITDDESDEEIQEFDEYNDLRRHFDRTFYYGREASSTERLSLPLTEFCVEHFNRMGLMNDLEESLKLDRLDMARASQVTRETCASPTSLVLALLYLDRLRGKNPAYLRSVSSTDLFLVSLMVASKFLYDDGEDDEVFNEEWATSGGMDRKDLNKLELEFLSSLDWRIYVSPEEFEKTSSTLESTIAQRQIARRKGEETTYADLLALSKHVGIRIYCDLIAHYVLKVTAVCVTAYAASLFTMLGTCHLLSRTHFGPSSVSTSISTLYSSVMSMSPPARAAAENSTTSSVAPRATSAIIHPGGAESDVGEASFDLTDSIEDMMLSAEDDQEVITVADAFRLAIFGNDSIINREVEAVRSLKRAVCFRSDPGGSRLRGYTQRLTNLLATLAKGEEEEEKGRGDCPPPLLDFPSSPHHATCSMQLDDRHNNNYPSLTFRSMLAIPTM